jgi:hypothetical protein
MPPHLLDVGIQQRRDGCGAGIVDKHGDARIVPQRGLDLGELHLIGKIGGQHFDGPSGLARQTCRKALQPRLVSGHQDEVASAAGEAIRIGRTDAGRGAGDEGCA